MMNNIELDYKMYILTSVLSDIDTMIDTEPIISFSDYFKRSIYCNIADKNLKTSRIKDNKNVKNE